MGEVEGLTYCAERLVDWVYPKGYMIAIELTI